MQNELSVSMFATEEGLLSEADLESIVGGGWGKAVVKVGIEVGKAIVTGIIGSAIYDAIKPGK